MKVYQAINAVQNELSKIGITKDRLNTQGNGYKFRGIDDVYNTISPLLAEHGLCILPRVISRECVERSSAKGNALFYVTVEVEFDFVSAEDGSKHTVKTFGEAMDSGDKATNKAMSAAYKYAAFQAFAIPTEGDNDTESDTHEVKSRPAPKNPLDIIEAPTKPSTGAKFHMALPGKEDRIYGSSQELFDAMMSLRDQIENSSKISTRVRMTKLRELREANEMNVDKMDIAHKSNLMGDYTLRLKRLGAQGGEDGVS
jgi:hypothetical protein